MMTKLSSGAGSIFGKIFVVFFLLLALSSLVLMDVRGVVSGGPGAANVASVNGEKISIRAFERSLFQMGQNFGLPREQLANQQIMGLALQNIVTERVASTSIYNEAHLRFDDTQIAGAIRDALFDPLDQSGLSLKDKYKQTLRNNNMREAEFEARMADDLGQRTLRQALMAANASTPLYDAVTKQLDAQTRNLVVFEVSATDKKGELGDAGESFVKSYFEANSDLFQTEETRSGVAYVLSEASMKDKDPTVVQDLLFEIEDAFAGASDFDEVAKQYELQKKEIAKNITQSGVNNEMQSVLFELDQDIVSDAMNDNGTFAFVTVTNITESQPIAFEDARPKIEDIWHDTQKAQSVEKNIVALRTSDDPRAFAADNNIDTNTVNNVTRQSAKPYLAPLFKSAALNKLVALDDGESGQKRLGMVTSIAPIGAIDKIDTATSTVNDQMANQDFEVLLSSWFENAEIDVNENALNLIAQNLKGADTN